MDKTFFENFITTYEKTRQINDLLKSIENNYEHNSIKELYDLYNKNKQIIVNIEKFHNDIETNDIETINNTIIESIRTSEFKLNFDLLESHSIKQLQFVFGDNMQNLFNKIQEEKDIKKFMEYLLNQELYTVLKKTIKNLEIKLMI